MQKYDVIIMHGTYGDPTGNWFPWLASKLRADGHNVYVPKFPTPENQSVRSWYDTMKVQTPHFGENTVLIGHSCGATYLLHIIEILPKPIAKSIFVSGFVDKLGNDTFDIPNETFVNHDFDWEKIKKNAGETTLFHGDNDPYVPLSVAQKLSDKLETPLTIIKNGGHLNTESGHTEFHEILNVLK